MRQVVIYIPKNIFSEIDAILPLLTVLSQRGVKLETVFFEKQSYNEVSTSPMHMRLLDKHTRMSSLFSVKGGFLARLAAMLRFAGIAAAHRLSGRSLTVIYNSPTNKFRLSKNYLWKTAMRSVISLLGGKIVSFPSIQAPQTELFLRREEPDVLQRRAKLEGISPATPPAPDHALAYTSLQRDGLRKNRGWACPITIIGLPRLYRGWTDALRTEAERDVEDMLRTNGLDPATPRFATILLTYPMFPWYKSPNSFYELVDQAIEHIQKVCPGLPIFMKAKPRYDEKTLFGPDKIRRRPGLYITSCALAALATRSQFAISIHETSGVFDFLTQGVPVIEYADYAPAWREIFPTPSPWVGLPGFRLAESGDELNAALVDVLEGRQRAEPARLAEVIGHKEDLSFFMGSA